MADAYELTEREEAEIEESIAQIARGEYVDGDAFPRGAASPFLWNAVIQSRGDGDGSQDGTAVAF